MSNIINIYIDGACSNNGKKDAKAGYGIYFGENDVRNENGRVKGKQTNNTGELTAFIKAVEKISVEKEVHIWCDSQYVIKSVTSYGDKLARNNWKTETNKIPPNLELVKKAYELYQNNKKIIKLHYIEAHTNKTDIHSIGNAEADRLACLAIGSEPMKKDDVVILDWVSFHNKDSAKELGALWDKSKKKWYIKANHPNLSKIIELQNIKAETKENDTKKESKVYINVPFAKKNIAKANGARWDPSVKSWYYIEETIKKEQKENLQSIAS